MNLRFLGPYAKHKWKPSIYGPVQWPHLYSPRIDRINHKLKDKVGFLTYKYKHYPYYISWLMSPCMINWWYKLNFINSIALLENYYCYTHVYNNTKLVYLVLNSSMQIYIPYGVGHADVKGFFLLTHSLIFCHFQFICSFKML